MRALLPVYCRPLGYFVIALALFLPFLMMLTGRVTDANLLFYKECSKLLMMLGALMILFALTKGECKATEEIRNKATRNAMFLTVLFIFGGMLYRVAQLRNSPTDGSIREVKLSFSYIQIKGYGADTLQIHRFSETKITFYC
jgi:uncharacterized membrane protein